MEWLFLRSTYYGSPFLNLHSGRDMRDSVNTGRIRKAMQTFRYSEEGQNLPHKADYTDQEVQICRIALPIAGLLFGRFLADIYCAPRSIYLKGIFTVGFGLIFNKFAMDFKNYNDVRYWERNFEFLPQDLQSTLKSHDARYTTRWMD